MLLHLLSLATKSAKQCLVFFSEKGKEMAEHQVTEEFLEEIWKLGLIIQYIKAAR